MPITGALADLRAEAGLADDEVAFLAGADDADVARLLAALRHARAEQQRCWTDAVGSVGRLVPRPLRGRALKLIFGSSRRDG